MNVYTSQYTKLIECSLIAQIEMNENKIVVALWITIQHKNKLIFKAYEN